MTQELQVVPSSDVLDAVMAPHKMNSLIVFSEQMATSKVAIPEHLRGKPADCLAICMQALQWGMNPFSVAQKTHLVSGKLGYEAQLVNAVVCKSGAITGSFKYEYRGETPNVECRVGAVLCGEAEITWSEWLNAATVTVKNSPLWKTNVKQQLGYVQVKNWARLYAPGAILGVYTEDELSDSTVGAPRAGPRRRTESEQDLSTKGPPMAEEIVPRETGDSNATEEKPVAVKSEEQVEPLKDDKTSPVKVTKGQEMWLRNKAGQHEVDLVLICKRLGISEVSEMSVTDFDQIASEIRSAEV